MKFFPLLAKPPAPRGLLRKASEQLSKPKLDIPKLGLGNVELQITKLGLCKQEKLDIPKLDRLSENEFKRKTSKSRRLKESCFESF